MRLRSIPGIEEKIKNEFPRIVFFEEEELRDFWPAYFGSLDGITLEIGMGRGQFLNEMRLREPKKNFVAVEMRNEMIYPAARKFGDDCQNVAVISGRADYLSRWFQKDSVERIFLNFSDPWPKRAHRKRRLSHENYLKLYRDILIPGGDIFFRTDVASLMEFTLTEMSRCGFSLIDVSLDFHHSKYFDGITTEYEDKKCKDGPIYYAHFILPK